MKTEREGTCRFCGQISVVEINAQADEMDDIDVLADAAATDRCTCPESREFYAMSKVDETLDALFGETSTEKGYRFRAGEEEMNFLRAACLQIYRGNIRMASLNLHGDTVALKEKKGVISIKRETRQKMEMDAV